MRNKERENRLLKQIETLENNLSDSDTHDEYKKLKAEWEQMENSKTEGVILRSKA